MSTLGYSGIRAERQTVLRWCGIALAGSMAWYVLLHVLAAEVGPHTSSFDVPGSLLSPSWSLVVVIAANNALVVALMLAVSVISAQAASTAFQHARQHRPVPLPIAAPVLVALLVFGLANNAVHQVQAAADLAWYLNVGVDALFWPFAPHAIVEFAVILLPLTAVLHSLVLDRSLDRVARLWRPLAFMSLATVVLLAPIEVFVSFPLVSALAG